MDPVSLTAAAASLTFACVKVCQGLRAVKQSYETAPLTVQSMISQCTAISLALTQLQGFTQNRTDSAIFKENSNLETVAQGFDDILTACMLTLQALEEELSSIVEGTGGLGSLGFKAKAKFIWKEDGMAALLSQLEGHNHAINLLLGIFNAHSMKDFKDMLENNTATLQEVVKKAKFIRQNSVRKAKPIAQQTQPGAGNLRSTNIETASVFSYSIAPSGGSTTLHEELSSTAAYQRAHDVTMENLWKTNFELTTEKYQMQEDLQHLRDENDRLSKENKDLKKECKHEKEEFDTLRVKYKNVKHLYFDGLKTQQTLQSQCDRAEELQFEAHQELAKVAASLKAEIQRYRQREASLQSNLAFLKENMTPMRKRLILLLALLQNYLGLSIKEFAERYDISKMKELVISYHHHIKKVTTALYHEATCTLYGEAYLSLETTPQAPEVDTATRPPDLIDLSSPPGSSIPKTEKSRSQPSSRPATPQDARARSEAIKNQQKAIEEEWTKAITKLEEEISALSKKKDIPNQAPFFKDIPVKAPQWKFEKQPKASSPGSVGTSTPTMAPDPGPNSPQFQRTSYPPQSSMYGGKSPEPSINTKTTAFVDSSRSPDSTHSGWTPLVQQPQQYFQQQQQPPRPQGQQQYPQQAAPQAQQQYAPQPGPQQSSRIPSDSEQVGMHPYPGEYGRAPPGSNRNGDSYSSGEQYWQQSEGLLPATFGYGITAAANLSSTMQQPSYLAQTALESIAYGNLSPADVKPKARVKSGLFNRSKSSSNSPSGPSFQV